MPRPADEERRFEDKKSAVVSRGISLPTTRKENIAFVNGVFFRTSPFGLQRWEGKKQ